MPVIVQDHCHSLGIKGSPDATQNYKRSGYKVLPKLQICLKLHLDKFAVINW